VKSIGNRNSVQYRSASLIAFLLGDRSHPGWLDQYNHPTFASFKDSSRSGHRENNGDENHSRCKTATKERQAVTLSRRAILFASLFLGTAFMSPFALYSQTTQPAQPVSPSQPAQPGGGSGGAAPAQPLLSFASAQLPVGSGLNNPFGIVMDAAGDLFIADTANNRVVELPAGGGAQTTVGSGFSGPTGLAVDAAGDLFVADTGNGQVVEIAAGGGAQTTVASGLVSPVGVAVDAAGDLFIADPTNTSVAKKPLNSRHAASSAGSGLSHPEGVALDAAGDLFIVDTGNNRVVELPAGGGAQTTVASGLNGPIGLAVDGSGDLFIANTGNNSVVEVPAGGGAQTTVGSGFSGPSGVALDPAGDVFIADTGNSRALKVVKEVSVNLGGVNVCAAGQAAPAPCSGTATLIYNVTQGGQLGAVNVLTAGRPNLDFTLAGTTCLSALEVGSTCAVNVTFAPTAPGARMGAVQLVYTDQQTQTVVATTAIYGEGQGPAIAFNPSTQTSLYPYGGISSYAVAVDGAGDVIISDNGNNQVVEVSPSGVVTSVVSGLNFAAGVAVDGAGDVFVVDANNNRVLEVPAGGGTVTTLGTGLNGPQGVAVDGAGDVFIADTFNNRVIEIQAGSGTQTTVGSGLNNPWGVAVDGAGDVFIADFHNNRVVEVPAGGGSQITVANGLNDPAGVAVDAAGDVFIADTFNSRVIEVPVGGGAPTTVVSGLNVPFGVALDGAGNIFIANTSSNDVLKVQRSQPPALSFASTAVGSTSSPQSVTVQNIGNQPLTAVAPGLSIGANFQQVDGSGTPADCTDAFSLTPGTSCNLSISFAPQTAGTIQSAAVLTDNALNATPAVQSISLSGTATSNYDSAITISLTTTQPVFPGATEMSVSVAGANGSPATGTVTVYDGTTPLTTLTLSYGTAWWWISSTLNVGTHQLSASYSGDANNPAGQSAPVIVTVTPAPVILSPSCWNSSFAYGGNYTCSVNVSSNAGGIVPGVVTYTLDGGSAVSVPLSGGNAEFTLTQPAVGIHTGVISYPQQGNFQASSPSTETFTVTAN